MMELDIKDENTELTSLFCEDPMFIAKLKDGIHKDADGHYETPLPFHDSSPCLPNNKAHAFRRLQQLKKRLQRNPKYHAVVQLMPREDLAQGHKDLSPHDALPVERALGVQWCMENYSFQFRITLRYMPLTRRGVLSTISSVYDPLGFIAPVILKGTMILQQLCRDNSDWDAPLSGTISAQWKAGEFLSSYLSPCRSNGV